MINPKTSAQYAAEARKDRKALLAEAERYIDKCITNSVYENSVTIYKSDFPVFLSERDFNVLVKKYKEGGWTDAYNYGNHIHLGVKK